MNNQFIVVICLILIQIFFLCSNVNADIISDILKIVKPDRDVLRDKMDRDSEILDERFDKVYESLGKRIDQHNQILGSKMDRYNEYLLNKIDVLEEQKVQEKFYNNIWATCNTVAIVIMAISIFSIYSTNSSKEKKSI